MISQQGGQPDSQSITSMMISNLFGLIFFGEWQSFQPMICTKYCTCCMGSDSGMAGRGCWIDGLLALEEHGNEAHNE